MTTARYRPTWELAVDPLVSCKLCLGEFPLEQMTTITQCQCVFCTLVSFGDFFFPFSCGIAVASGTTLRNPGVLFEPEKEMKLIPQKILFTDTQLNPKLNLNPSFFYIKS